MARLSAEEMFKNMIGRKDEEPQPAQETAAAPLRRTCAGIRGDMRARREFPDKTFTWPQYEKIKKEKGEDAAATALLDAEAAGKVVIKDVIADAFLQNTLLVPEEYSVIATLNLNGDYVSDQLAAVFEVSGSPDENLEYTFTPPIRPITAPMA